MKDDKLILKSQVKYTGRGSHNNSGENGEVWEGGRGIHFQISRCCETIVQTTPSLQWFNFTIA